jgi:excisionase family DNA binding protein
MIQPLGPRDEPGEPTPPELKDLVYTAAQAAGILKLRRDTVYLLLREGRLDGTKISSRNYRISRAALLRFINGQAPTGEKP